MAKTRRKSAPAKDPNRFHKTFVEKARGDEFGHHHRNDRAQHARCSCGWWGLVYPNKTLAQADADQHERDSE